MGATQNYGIGFFDFGSPLGTDFSGQVEIDRFIFIDKQIYGLMSIFGNGVLSGWTVAAEEAFTLSIAEGSGNINFTAARTVFPSSITDVPPNSLVYVYAKIAERTRFTEDLDFVLATTPNLVDPNFLLLAEVETGALSIERVDNSVRQQIRFIELIRTAIRLHKHRGGSLHPSKIDLASEVKGQLPSFRIADFDAEKITTGTFDLSRMPLIDHQELQNVGILTHPQLDTFVKTLEVSNKEIFGEIGTANLLQLILAMKFIHDDPDSAFYIGDKWLDQYFINEFAVIPGITPNSFIDFENSTAIIDLDQHFIRGIAPSTGTSFYANWDTALAWNSAYFTENIIVSGNSVTLAFNEDNESNIFSVEGFESATAKDQDLSGGNLSLFKKETVVISDNAAILSKNSEVTKTEGFYSGEFTAQQSFRLQYVKDFSSAQDWSTYDSFVFYVKCLDLVHGPVKLYFEDSAGNKSIDYIVLETSTIDNPNTTSNPTDLSANDFEQRVIDLANIPFRGDIKKFAIYTDDLSNQFAFYIDDIHIQRRVLLPDNGTIKLRYASGSKVIFSTIEWDSTELAGTEITARAKAADGTALLTRANYTPLLNSGDLINLEGTDLEIEIQFFPDADKINAPILNWLRVLILSEAEIDGVQINTTEEFSRGDGKNIEIVDNHLELDTPIYVDSYYFILSNLVNQVHKNTSGTSTFTEPDDVALFGTTSPVAPNTVFSAVESNQSGVSARFFEPRSVRRQDGRTFIIADTYNDRVLEYEEDGTLIAGFGSINYTHSSKTFPVAAAYDVRTAILYVIWSRKILFSTVNVSQIKLQTIASEVGLIKDFDKIKGMTTEELGTTDEGQILPIHLSSQNAGLVQQFPANDSRIFFGDSTLSSGIDKDSEFYKRAINAIGQLPMFVGNFAYIDGIFSPTWADKTDSNTYIVANAKIAVKEWDFPAESFSGSSEDLQLVGSGGMASVSSIVEVDSNNQMIFGTDVMNFSPFVPGRAEKIDDHTLLIGGLRPGGVIGTDLSGDLDFNFRTVGGSPDIRQIQKQTLNEMFFTKASSPIVGAVTIYDTRSQSTTFEYLSAEGIVVSDVDIDPISGTYVVAESSFDKSGRIIKLDSSGNIVFSFGEGTYGLINSINVQVDGSIVIST